MERSPEPMQSEAVRTPVPVTVLTGFLGAGKTTLLNRILTGNHGLRVAVLVNDFGSINIDADLVVGVESDVISLANGCVCCSIRDDLTDAVERVIARPERPEYVLLEASGVADPVGITVTFSDVRLRDRIRLDSITCVLDAEQVFAVPEQMKLKLWQIAAADLLVLNKVDLVGRDRIEAIKAWLDEHFYRYRLIEAERGNVRLEILLSAGRLDATQSDKDNSGHDAHNCHESHCHHNDCDHARAFSSWSFETDQPMSLDAVQEVAARLPAGIYRCKGVVHSVDNPEWRAVLQVVGKRVDIRVDTRWGDRSPYTRIVAIGAPDALGSETLRAKFKRCIVEGRPGVVNELACTR